MIFELELLFLQKRRRRDFLRRSALAGPDPA
jgi:hypothetical protein